MSNESLSVCNLHAVRERPFQVNAYESPEIIVKTKKLKE